MIMGNELTVSVADDVLTSLALRAKSRRAFEGVHIEGAVFHGCDPERRLRWASTVLPIRAVIAVVLVPRWQRRQDGVRGEVS